MAINKNRNKIHRSTAWYTCARVLFTAYFSVLCKLTIQGREHIPSRGPCIVVPKHQHWLDIPVVGFAAQVPCHYIAKKELFEVPLVKNLMIWLGGISLDRQHPIRSLNSFRYIEYLLMRGEVIVLFPEGTYFPHTLGDGKFKMIEWLLSVHNRLHRNSDGALIPFVPIGIQYGTNVVRPEIRVKIGSPLYCEDQAHAQKFTEKIMETIGVLSGLK
jgi:1-acyl-sn-glycerol-3-phosphate acyltransferase